MTKFLNFQEQEKYLSPPRPSDMRVDEKIKSLDISNIIDIIALSHRVTPLRSEFFFFFFTKFQSCQTPLEEVKINVKQMYKHIIIPRQHYRTFFYHPNSKATLKDPFFLYSILFLWFLFRMRTAKEGFRLRSKYIH